MKILLLVPPFTGLNTPYPATTVLKAYLDSRGHDAVQGDLGIEVAGKLFSKDFLSPLFRKAFECERLSFKAKSIAARKEEYLSSVDAVWRFLQGKDASLAVRIASRNFLPEGPRFKRMKDEELEWAFGTNGTTDLAKHIATLYIEDLTDFIAEMCGTPFELVRYGEQLALSAPSFDRMEKSLAAAGSNEIDRLMFAVLDEKISRENPRMIGFTVPFPGTLYAALACCRHIRENYPSVTTVLGGGYVNTELRSLKDARIFDYVHYLTLDDGEEPLQRLAAFIAGECEKTDLVRTKYAENGTVKDSGNYACHVPFADLPCPDFEGLPLEEYVSMIEINNPMHKLWSDGKWNKMTAAHGCYWAKCAFCDTLLDYIRRYEAPKAAVLADRMERIMQQTGSSGFHFTDEALPPALLRALSEEILKRGMAVSFWGNIRFEKAYDEELCELLAKAGCIAVSGGLEVASPRILRLIRKGVTLEQAAKAAAALTNAGIMVHAYLMYGFPSQTRQECADSLEVVRQMFEQGIVQSAFWHRYAMTVHSPSGQCPEDYGVTVYDRTVHDFANNAVEYEYEDGIDWETIGSGLAKATHNYMHGLGYDIPLSNWCGKALPRPKVKNDYIAKIIEE